MCEICPKLTIKASDVVLVSLLLTLNIFTHCSVVSTVEFGQVNIDFEFQQFQQTISISREKKRPFCGKPTNANELAIHS